MKKAVLIIIVCCLSNLLKAQNAPVAIDCTSLLKIAELANNKQLKTVEGEAFTSKYYQNMFGGVLYSSKLTLPGVMENFINDDPKDGTSFHAFIKDYGTDAEAAQVDFAVLSHQYEACFTNAAVTHPDATTTYIIFKKTRIQVHAYRHGGTGTWVCKISIEYKKY